MRCGTLFALAALTSACVADSDGLDGLTSTRPSLRLLTERLPGGVTGEPYSARIEAVDDGGAITWTILTGPEWLSPDLDEGPLLIVQGLPPEAGTFTLVVQAATPDGRSIVGTFEGEIEWPPLSIEPVQLPPANVDLDYRAVLSVSGGAGPPWSGSIAEGRLPAGLNLREDLRPGPGPDPGPGEGGPFAEIAGTPSEQGTFTFRVRVADQAGQVAERDYVLTVGPRPMTIMVVQDPMLAVGSVGRGQWSVLGGQGPYRWTVRASENAGAQTTAGQGERLAVTFEPVAGGPASIELRVRDAMGREAELITTLEVVAAPLQILTSSLSDGRQCLGFGEQLRATGSVNGVYEWTVVDGELPPGIRVANGDLGNFIQGVFTTPGRYAFTLEVSDGAGGQDRRDYTLEVNDGDLRARHVAAIGTFNRPGEDVVVVDVCGPQPVSETIVSPQPPYETEGEALLFSPDATQIAFTGNYAIRDDIDLYVTRVDTPMIAVASRRLGGVGEISWAPDSRWLAAYDSDSVRLVGASTVLTRSTPGLVELKWAPVLDARSPRFAWARTEVQRTLMVTVASGATAQLSTGALRVGAFEWFDGDNIIYSQADRTEFPISWDLYQTQVILRSTDRLTVVESPRPLEIAVHPRREGLVFSGARSGWIRYVNGVAQTPVPLLSSFETELGGFEWSPDGSEGVGRTVLNEAVWFRFRNDGSVVAQVFELDPPAEVADVRFSGDGRYALMRVVEGGVGDLMAADLRGPTPTRAVTVSQEPDRSLNGVSAFFSAPDGSRAAFAGQISRGATELFAVDLTGAAPTQPVRVTGPLTNFTGLIGTPAWRPDGRTIFYMSDEVSRGLPELWMVNFFGGRPSRPGRVSVLPLIASRIQRFAVPPR